jgi:hypothetical protein
MLLSRVQPKFNLNLERADIWMGMRNESADVEEYDGRNTTKTRLGTCANQQSLRRCISLSHARFGSGQQLTSILPAYSNRADNPHRFRIFSYDSS